jgi:hypothetical protein
MITALIQFGAVVISSCRGGLDSATGIPDGVNIVPFSITGESYEIITVSVSINRVNLIP